MYISFTLLVYHLNMQSIVLRSTFSSFLFVLTFVCVGYNLHLTHQEIICRPFNDKNKNWYYCKWSSFIICPVKCLWLGVVIQNCFCLSDLQDSTAMSFTAFLIKYQKLLRAWTCIKGKWISKMRLSYLARVFGIFRWLEVVIQPWWLRGRALAS